MSQVYWLSIDPVRRKIDFYPKNIALRIEKSYEERDHYSISNCVLGKDFFNATIHFHPSGSCYQTTPGMSLGRAGFKQPGYRSVKRCVKSTESDYVKLFSKQVHGEWRITNSEFDSDITFEETIPSDCLIYGNSEIIAPSLRVWNGSDINSGSWDVNVIVWQWCRGVPERQGNLMALSDEWWCPYLANETILLEEAFLSGRSSVDIELPICGSRTFRFIPNQSFASQNDDVNNKTRLVRRVTKTIQELKIMLHRIASAPVDISELVSNLPDGVIPHHFFCCISQSVMTDPVKTIDGHIYDRTSIERWFQINNTSPLTGLHLSSMALEPHDLLRTQIENFLKSEVANLSDEVSSIQLDS